MRRVVVDSSAIYTLGYDRKTQVLEVVFLTGNTYWYYRVPESVYTTLRKASSVGEKYNELIKGHYNYVKVPLNQAS